MEISLLPLLEAGGPRSRGRHVWFLLWPLSEACGWPTLLLCLHMLSSGHISGTPSVSKFLLLRTTPARLD